MNSADIVWLSPHTTSKGWTSNLCLVTARIDLDLAQASHRFSPELLKTFRQAIREFAVTDEQRRESAF